MSRKTIEHNAKREYILSAARILFDDKGVEHTSMDDIALASEYTRRTLYAYFKSRDEISLSIFVEDLAIRWTEQKQELTKADTGLGKIIKWAESFYSFTLRHPHSIHMQAYWDFKGIDSRLISDDIFAAFEAKNSELAEGLREIFHLGQIDGTLRSDLNIDLAISQFLYSLRSIVKRALSSTYSFVQIDPNEYIKHFLDIFVRGIQSEGVNQDEIR